MKLPSVYDCSIIRLAQVGDRKGHITAINNGVEIPFEVKRVFYLYDIPGGESRGAHAHKACHQFLVAASGSFEVLVDDGSIQRVISLNRPMQGLHIPPGIWASEINFSAGSICLVLASHPYGESDYIRNYEDFFKVSDMIHPLADVQSTDIGKSTQIWQFAVVLKGARIGDHCNINCHTFIENDVIIGNNVTVKSGTYIWDGIRIADDVFIGPAVVFTNDLTPRSKKRVQFVQTVIERGASIGANSSILAGTTIGAYALIGMGAVVTKDVPAYALVYGQPARIQGWVDESGEKLTPQSDTEWVSADGNLFRLIEPYKLIKVT